VEALVLEEVFWGSDLGPTFVFKKELLSINTFSLSSSYS
jgi:hypothetical protein